MDITTYRTRSVHVEHELLNRLCAVVRKEIQDVYVLSALATHFAPLYGSASVRKKCPYYKRRFLLLESTR